VLNALGSRGAIRGLSALTILKFLPLIAILSFGVLRLHWESPLETPAVHDLGAAVLLVIYVYTGYESGLVIAGEARNPQRDLPRALLPALFGCAGLYVLFRRVSGAT